MNECIKWRGHIAKNGYGRLSSKLAHKIVFERVHGTVPNGYVVMHTCDNKACVNIDHLKLGTQSDNIKDCVRKGRFGKRRTQKLPDEAVAEIKALGRMPMSERRVIAAKFGVAVVSINAIIYGRTWSKP